MDTSLLSRCSSASGERYQVAGMYDSVRAAGQTSYQCDGTACWMSRLQDIHVWSPCRGREL